MQYTTITEISEKLIEEHMQAAIHAEDLEGKNFFLNRASGVKTLWSELLYQAISFEMSLDKKNEKRRYFIEKEKMFSNILDRNRVFQSD